MVKSITDRFRRWRMRRLLLRNRIPFVVWCEVSRHIAALRDLNAVQRAQLRKLSTWFLHNKAINGVHGLEVTLPMRITVAAQACLLILNLDVDYFDNWVEVILYPGAFRVQHEHQDGNGLVHMEENILSGEAWLRGPVILSWDDVARDSEQNQHGRNVVIHEFAHKLDGRNGVVNGLPPLRRGMNRTLWAEAFNASYRAFCQQVETGNTPCINPYAATSPAEFFAVSSEYFYTAPEILNACWPAVHEQLSQFYQQTTIS